MNKFRYRINFKCKSLRQYSAVLHVVVISVKLAGQSEIGHFYDVVMAQQNIAGRQITVQHLLQYF